MDKTFDKNDAFEIGTRIYQRRKALGMSQKDLYISTGIPRQTISAIENGNRSVNIKTLTALAYALKTPLSEFQPQGLDQYMEISPEIYQISKKLQALPLQERHRLIAMLEKILE